MISRVCSSVKCWFQLIFCTLINNLVYGPSKRFSNCCDIVHDSEPYRSMLSTQVLNKFIFVLAEIPEVHMVWSLLETAQICAFLILKYFLQNDIYDNRYLKSSTCINVFSFTLCHNYSVLLQFVCKPRLLACNRDAAFSKLSDVRAISSA